MLVTPKVRARLERGAGAGSSTVSETSLLLRKTPSFTFWPWFFSFAPCFTASFPRKSPTVRTRSPSTEVMTSPALRPAFSAGPGIHIANQNAFPVWRPKERAELPVEVFCVNAQTRLPAHQQPTAVPFHGRDHGHFRHVEGETPGGAGPRGKDFERLVPFLALTESHAQCLRTTIAP